MQNIGDRPFLAAVAAIVLLIGLGAQANAQTAPGPGPSPTPSPAPSPAPSGATTSSPAPSGEPLAAATHAALRSQTDIADRGLSDYLLWRLRGMAQALARTAAGDGSDGVVRGMSAGSPAQNFAAWGDATASYLKNDTAAFANEGYGVTALAGIDDAYGEHWLFGFNAGYVRTQLKVKALGGTKLEDGATLGPYLSYVFGPHVAVDSSFTYGRLGNSFTGSSSFDADRFTGAANVDLFADSGGFKLSGIIGYVYASENPATSGVPAIVNGFPTSQRYGAVKVSGEVAYPMGRAEPYLPLAYTYETTRPVDAVGRNTLTLGAGLRYQMSDSLNGSIQVTDDELRTHSRDDTVSANLRLSF
jgi:uncharacterized protein with beta-barrel porin domain